MDIGSTTAESLGHVRLQQILTSWSQGLGDRIDFKTQGLHANCPEKGDICLLAEHDKGWTAATVQREAHPTHFSRHLGPVSECECTGLCHLNPKVICNRTRDYWIRRTRVYDHLYLFGPIVLPKVEDLDVYPEDSHMGYGDLRRGI